MLAQAGRFRQAPSAAAEGARRKAIGAHADLQLPGAVGGGFRWGGQIMHSPEEAYAYSRSHGSPLGEDEFYARYNELGQMRHPAAETGLEAAAPAAQVTVQPGGPMQGLGQNLDELRGELPPLGRLGGIRSHRGGSSQAEAVRQALLAAHVIHKLRGLAALQHAAV